jgi:capsular exopolysaccharide synthesis family protein
MYPAKAVVALEIRQQNVMKIENVLSSASGGSEEINTEVEVIQSRYLIEALVKNLNLINDPEFNVALQKHSNLNPIPYLNALFYQPERKQTQEQILNGVVDFVIEAISISNIRQSLAFAINITTNNPDKSAKIANALADLYIQNSLDKKMAATEKASNRLSEKATELKLEWESSEARVKNFSDKTQLISAKALDALSIQLKEMRVRISDLDVKRSLRQADMENFERAKKTGDIHLIANQSQNIVLQGMADELSAKATVRPEFDLQVARITNTMREEVKRLDQQYNTLRVSERLFKNEVDTQSADLVELQQLRREAQMNGLLYERFLTRLKETIVQQGMQQSDSRLLSAAVPRLASSPNKGVILALSALMGSMLGVGLVLIHELKDNTFRFSNNLEAFTGYKVLGSIPKIKVKEQKNILKYMKDKPTSVFVEAVRNLRTSVLLPDLGEPPQVIMLTSSVPGEGKTMQALALAQNLSGLGKSVLVIEGDIRKCAISEYFSLEKQPSFLSVMSGKVTLDEAIYKSADMGIDILLGDKSTGNAVDIFASKKFTDLLIILRKKYNYIIIETAPVLAVPDARIIGQYVDANLYTVLWNNTSKMSVKQGLAMFQSVGLHVTGLILNQIDHRKMRRFGTKAQCGYDDASSYYEN